MVPFLYGSTNLIQALILSVLMWFVHIASFGENSLLDYTQGWDSKDPSKKHHPLCRKSISVHTATHVILWGLGCLAIVFVSFTFLVAENLPMAMAGLFLYYVFGSLYNEGLSKQSPLGFMSISLSFTFMATWAWFLTHKTLDYLGTLYVGYVFLTILFQISYSGFLKELEIEERSNILVKMGARIEDGKFLPGKARFYAYLIKGVNLTFGGLLLYLRWNPVRLVAYILLATAVIFFLWKLTKPRIYNRGKELLSMSLEEIATIYLPIPIMLGLLESLTLMLVGIGYFFGCCLLLWGKPFPRV